MDRYLTRDGLPSSAILSPDDRPSGGLPELAVVRQYAVPLSRDHMIISGLPSGRVLGQGQPWH